MSGIDHRKFAQLVGDQQCDAAARDDERGDDFITFYRSEYDGEWYVTVGHRTAGACTHMAGTYKANCDDALDEIHDASEMVTVFQTSEWSEV